MREATLVSIFMVVFFQMLFLVLKIGSIVTWSWWIVFIPWFLVCAASVVFVVWAIVTGFLPKRIDLNDEEEQLDFFDKLDERS